MTDIYMGEGTERCLYKVKPKVLILGRNTIGRDFIVGDIHGAYDELIDCLYRVEFDTYMDRLFCTGDMIDRGPKSYEVLEFFATKPFAFAVMGNHEFMLKEANEGGYPNRELIKWYLHLPPDKQQEAYKMVCQLPYAIVVEGEFNVLHAEFFGNQNDLENGNLDLDRREPPILWGRDRIRDFRQGVKYRNKLEYKTYVGHSVVREPTTIDNLVYIDTGCKTYPDGYLTIVEHKQA